MSAIARCLALLAVGVAGCSRSPKGLSIDGGASPSTSPTANASAAVTATTDASAEPDRSVDAAAPHPTAQLDPTGLPYRVVPLPSDDALVRSACLVEADCAAPGGLDASAYVYLESDAARSCEPSKTAECPALEQTVSYPDAVHRNFGPLCRLVGMRKNLANPGGGAPRKQARVDLRKLAARRAPCGSAILQSRHWCIDYRSNGTPFERSYFANVNPGSKSLPDGGEFSWFQKLDETGTVTEEFTDCDAGHH